MRFELPSTNVISSKLSMTLPYFNERLPLELFAIIPPTEQYSPIDGFGGKNLDCLLSLLSSSPFVTPGSTSTKSFPTLILLRFFKSMIIPSFNALPTSPVPVPRGVTERLTFFPNSIISLISATFFGNATSLGLI